MKINLLRGIVVCLLACACIPRAMAQLSTASVNGTVRDSSGSIISGATLLLKNVETGVERTAVSNDSGNYSILNIPPGKYVMEATKAGFAVNRVAQFPLLVNQTATLDFTLNVGSIQQSVTVEAVGEQVQASTAELGAVVTERQVVELPLNGRNFTQLLALTPGVAPISVSQNSGGGFTASAVGSFTFPSINGQTNRSNFFMLDGINNQESFNSTYAIPPIIDTIQEFKVVSHNDEAQFGGVLGGIVNVVTKSGTNQFHGSAWEFLRNDAFDARNTFFKSVTPFRWNQFGAALGGPVIIPKIYHGQNHTFFSVGYEGYRLRRPNNAYYRVPTEANLRGDLSDWPRQIYNPFSTRPDPNNPGKFIRDPFPGNIIPANLIDARNLAFAKATLPTPIFTGNGDRNALDTTPTKTNQEEYTARVDQTLGQKDFFWFRYSGLIYDVDRSGGRQALAASQENLAKNYGASWVHTFGPSSTLQAQFGRVRTTRTTLTRFRNPAFAKDVAFSDQFAGGFIGGVSIIPALSVSNFFSGGESDDINIPVRIWQEKADYSLIRGSHTFKMGGELNSNNFESFYRNANSTFAEAQTGDPQNLASTGSPLASFLLNVPDSAGRRNVHETMRWGGVMSFYLQDQWKVTPRLTMNIGLRYDRTFIPPYGKTNTVGQNGGIETGSLDLNRGVYLLQKAPPACSERGHAPCLPGGVLPDHVLIEPRGKIYHDTTNNYQPRVGLAYRLGQSTAIRASFGVFYDNWAAITQTAQNYEGAWPDAGQQLANNLNYPTGTQVTPNITGQKPFLAGLLPEPTPFNQVQWFMDPLAKNPYSLQWNFGIQHQFAESSMVSANYVGSGSRRLDIGGYYNVALTPGPGSPRARSPFPYIAPTYYDRSWGRSNYNAFQFLLNSRFSHGLTYMVSYTWSKAIDIGCSGWYGVEGCSVQDPYHFNNDRSVAGFDITHMFTTSWVYQLPVGSGKLLSTGSSVADYILGNWQINGIATLRSGQPYSLVVSGDIANTGNVGSYERLNLIGNPHLDHPSPSQWFNRAAFAPPAQYTFGNLGRNRMRSDFYKNVDLSIFREFPIREITRIEFRAEAFNLLNQVVYGVPVNNYSNVNFGKVLGTANGARQLQFGLKVRF